LLPFVLTRTMKSCFIDHRATLRKISAPFLRQLKAEYSMRPRFLTLRAVSLALLIAALSASGYDNARASYLSKAQIDISKLIAPPPAPDSDSQKSDLKAVLAAQEGRTAAQIARANETEQLAIFSFSDVLGPSFVKEKLPKTANLFQGVYEDTLVLLKVAKDRWNRPRPFLTSDEVKPSGERPKSSSYPSGNALLGQLYAIILADLLPEKSATIFARGRETGDNRVIAGVHFPSDLDSGRQAAAAIAAALWATPGFQSDLAAARTELQSAGF
jgi:acid phosphatase (class A)